MNSDTPAARLIPIVLFFAGLIALYYLYQYLFGVRTGNAYPLLTKTQSATVDKPISIPLAQLPSIFEGGEFTVSTWIYVTNWSHHMGLNKSILTVGGSNFDTIRIFLGANKPSVSIRLHTKDSNAAVASGMNTVGATVGAAASPSDMSLEAATRDSMFQTPQMGGGLLDSHPICDIREIGLQRWVNLTVSVNGKTVDTYVDGKLMRSCVLPSTFKVDTGYTATLLGYGGFGGQIANTVMYDAALNPEAVHTNYMAGPEPITSIGQWFARFFEPSLSNNVTSSA
jgi:hypothetical protein